MINDMTANPMMKLYFPFRGICRACLKRKFFLDTEHEFCTRCIQDYTKECKKVIEK